MAKLKPLLPTLRERKRYIAFEMLSTKEISYKDCRDVLQQTVQQLFGTLGLSQMGMLMVKEHYAHNRGVLRVSHNSVSKMRAAMAFVTQVNQIPCIVKSIKTSGMINKVKEMK